MTDYRRLIVAWLPLFIPPLALAGLWLYLTGTDSEVDWPGQGPAPVAEPSAQVPAPMRQLADLQTFSAVWELPLFAEQRRPDRQGADVGNPPPALDDLMLTGVVVAPPLRVALFRRSGNEVLSVKEGDPLPNGWSLAHIEEQKVELTFGEHRHTLQISSPRLPMSIQ